MNPEHKDQLDRIEAAGNETRGIVTKLWERVDRLERKASFWGVVGGALAMLVSKLAGCM